ncbi:hypothetical protein AWB75_06642 [Caballeronia catudaia]|uniref:Uncharacterized protein n=1 Tax=Caballeronia catudaia TaxID=1777136 RepID=A0A158DFJ8_9BURK|nr:hypothetical protein AWB75_06642 [Caballeronia catudaia]
MLTSPSYTYNARHRYRTIHHKTNRNMNQTNITDRSPGEIYAEAGDAILKYMTDCHTTRQC